MIFAQRDRRPLAKRTYAELMQRIRTGEFKPGQRIPSELELARTYNISRMTVREAIKALQQDHLLYTIHGRGSYVSHTLIDQPITRLQSGTELTAELGYLLTTQVLGATVEAPTDAIAAALRLQQGTEVLRLERLRLLDGAPALYTIDRFAADLVEQGRPREAWEGSLFDYIQHRTGTPISYTNATLRAEVLDAPTSARIGAVPGLPWFVMEQTNFTSDDRPLMYSLDYHRGDLFSFDVVRRRY